VAQTTVRVTAPWRNLVRAAEVLRDRAGEEWVDGNRALSRALWAVSAQLDPAGHRAAGPAPWASAETPRG